MSGWGDSVAAEKGEAKRLNALGNAVLAALKGASMDDTFTIMITVLARANLVRLRRPDTIEEMMPIVERITAALQWER